MISNELRAEIALHVSNPDRREGEENLSLLVVQEAGKATDRVAMTLELDAAIKAARAEIAR
jgi:hypothetical protein